MLTKFVANIITKPRPGKTSPVFGTPKEFELEYEDVTFKASDGVTLSGWLVKGAPEKVIVFTHFGMQSSRSGYTPKGKGPVKAYKKKIEYLKMVKHLVNDGYTVLMYDLRNHGNSERGTNPWVTGGVEEYKDVIAAVDFITTHDLYKTSNIGLLSFCMGANSTTYAYTNGLKEYKNIKALIALQPSVNSDFLMAFGFKESLVKKANEYNMSRGGADLFASCSSNVKDITVPTMLVQTKEDPWANMDFINQFYEELTVEKEMLWTPGEKRFEGYEYFGKNPEPMLNFYKKYL